LCEGGTLDKWVHVLQIADFLLCHAHRILADMGASLDWFTELAACRKLRIIFGPGKSTYVGLLVGHPQSR
jgi:hypothetical protein